MKRLFDLEFYRSSNLEMEGSDTILASGFPDSELRIRFERCLFGWEPRLRTLVAIGDSPFVLFTSGEKASETQRRFWHGLECLIRERREAEKDVIRQFATRKLNK